MVHARQTGALPRDPLRHHRERTLLNPWQLDAWRAEHAVVANVPDSLALLDVAFPAPYRRHLIETSSFHSLEVDLVAKYNRRHLLALGEELLIRDDGADVWMGGKLRDPRQYAHTSSEFLAARLLRAFGRPIAQPFGNKLGCDYLVGRQNKWFAAEVKSLRQSVRSDRAERTFATANPGHNGLLPDRDWSYEARRLYARMKHAAKQLNQPARAGLPGLLLLDLVGDNQLTNLCDRIFEWMDKTDWARAIDAVFFIDHVPQTGGWGTVAKPACWRDDEFWSDAFAHAGGLCTQGHIHVGFRPPGGVCDYRFV